MRDVHLDFSDSQLLDLTEDVDYDFPHPVQRIVLPIILIDNTQARPLGTGFLIGPGLVVTARHVIDAEVERVMAGQAHLAALYLTDQPLPSSAGPWGGPLRVLHLSMAVTPQDHDLALLSTEFPELPDGSTPRPNALPLTFELPLVGSSVLVLGYSEMEGGPLVDDPGAGGLQIPHTQRIRASQGRIEQLHLPRRDNAMLTFPVIQSDYLSPHGMSGGPVLNENGQVIGVVCSSLDPTEDGGAISYASLTPPLLNLETDYGQPQPRAFRSLRDLLDTGVLPGDGTHRSHPLRELAD